MKQKSVIVDLQAQYPGRTIIENKNSKGTTTEIICELTNSQDSIADSVAIAVIDSSTIHYHKVITEKYEVLKGSLTIFKYDDSHKEYKEQIVRKGESIVINPGEIHSNLGDETWVKVTSNPAWFIEDYYNLEIILKKYLKKN
jgi:hypothetical protein